MKIKNYIMVVPAMLGCVLEVARAAPITVLNPGFEQPVLADGGETNLPPAWSNGYYDLTAPGVWVVVATNAGAYNPTPADGYGGIAPEGSNVGYATSSGGFDIGLGQILATNLQADMRYDLRALVGNPVLHNGGPTADYRIELLAGGVPLSLDTGPSPVDDGYWATSSLTYFSGPNPAQLGQPLEIRLLAVDLPGGLEVDFDDVALSAMAGSDTNPPNPNPMTFAVPPASVDGTTIDMTATVATDVSGPVEYFFTNLTNGAVSGWLTNRTWINTGLTDGIAYGYRVKARDAFSNETAWSSVLLAEAIPPCGLGGIIVEDVQSTVIGFWQPGLLWAAYDASGSDKLVVTVSGENKNGGTCVATGMTYGGMPMTQAVQLSGSGGAIGTAAIFYLDAPGPAGDIFVTWNNAQNGQIATLMTLSGTADGVSVVSSATSSNVSLTTSVNNSLVVAHHYNQGIPNHLYAAPTADAPLTESVSSRGANRYFGVAGGYQTNATPSAVTPTFTTGAGAHLLSVAAAFEPGSPLILSKLASVTNVSFGGSVTYTLDVLNNYTSVLGGITVTDSLPVTVGFVSSTPPADQTNGNDYVFNLGSLEPGSNAIITIDVVALAPATTTIVNRATAFTTNANLCEPSSSASVAISQILATDLALTKSVSIASTNLEYTILIVNRSSNAVADNVTVVDTLPPELVFRSAVPTESGVTGNDYTFNLAGLAPMASTQIVISTVSTTTIPTMITNVARVSTTTFEDRLSNNTDFVVSAIGSTLDLTLTKTVNPTNLPPGSSNLIYTIIVTNLDTQFVCGIVVTDTIPVGIDYLFAVPPATETNGNSYVFDLLCMAPGSSTSIVINAAYTSAVGGVTLTNWANVNTTNEEFILNNNFDTALTTVGAPCSTNDTDGDGMSDCDEICAGTDPLDPTSYLWIQITRTGTTDVQRFTFPTSTGRIYRIESSTNLYSNDWKTVFSNLPGIGTSRNQMHTGSVPRMYFRIGVVSP